MKQIVTIIVLLIGSSILAQHKYKIEYSLTLDMDSSPDAQLINYLTYQISLSENTSPSGSYLIFYSNVNYQFGDSPAINTTMDEVINLDFIPNYVIYQGSGPTDFCTFYETMPVSSNINCQLQFPTGLCLYPSNGLDFTRMIPIENLTNINANTTLTSCEDLEISVADCSSPFSYKVEYQYQADSGTSNWNTLLNYDWRSPTFTVGVDDFPGITSTDTNIKLRVVYEDSPSPYGEILTVDLTKCSPKVLASSSTDESCEYTNDGNFTLTFDRPLDPGEIITTAILDWAGPNNILNDGDDINSYASLTDLTYAGTTYTWPSTLDSGVYRIRYQTNNTNTQESHEPIEINAPTPVVFSILSSTDLSCFEEGSGSMTVEANGGTGSYEYSLDNGNTYSSFTSNPMVISGLSVGEYDVRVRDSNQCEQQN
ncbi:hypothetical protein GCM10009117_14690 [Gangjinia marincola]|uniref:SprB repeat-containing protein n=1 Tax=Gangjinia marincola TaxID=578463 RepID=A0ABP3XSY1_9FLAO